MTYTKVISGKRVWADPSVLSGSGSIMEKMRYLQGGLLEVGFEKKEEGVSDVFRTFLLRGIQVTVDLYEEELFVQVGGRRVVCRSHDFHKVFEVIRELWSEAQARA